MASLALGMAQIVVPPFISPLIQKLFDGWLEESPSNAELEKEIRNLASHMEIISRFLQDADNKQSQDSAVHTWLKSLKEVFYDAEDILDEYATDVAIKKMDTAYEENTHQEWTAKVMEKIKYINKLLSDRLDMRRGLGLQIVKQPCPELLLGGRKTTWLPDDFPMEGRNEDIKRLIFQILEKQKLSCDISNCNKSTKFIFPVVGMGGMGKTTIAKNIFNDHEIGSYFGSMKVWICVPNNSSAEDLLKNIIDSIYQSKEQYKRCKWIDLEEEEVAQLLIQIGACSVVHLKRLEIRSCPDLKHFEGLQLALPSLTSSLTTLKDLRVEDCPSLVSLLLPASISMDYLRIVRCPDLLHINSSDSHPSLVQIKSVYFNGCPTMQIALILQQIKPDHLESLVVSRSDLEHFHSYDGRGIQLLPNLLNFTSLKELAISNCENIKSLPSELGTRLRLLERVEVTYCPLLSHLPDLRPLTSLKRLTITGCPKLQDLQ